MTLQIVGDADDAQIGGFFDYIYGGIAADGTRTTEQGYVYLARKVPGDQRRFQQHFFLWPDQREDIVQYVIQFRANHEVYFAPALFNAPSALKEQVKGARVFWVDLDGRVPDLSQYPDVPPPSLRIRSSVDGHEHWYWKTDQLYDTKTLERINRTLMYRLDADTSGWDANQILRPPMTFNHKRQAPVSVIALEQGSVSAGNFHTLPEPPPPVDVPVPDRIPDVQELVFKFKWDNKVYELFRSGVQMGRRSEAEMFLGHSLAEMGMTNEEMLSVLLNADQRWGKFQGRDDQLKRLMEIVTIARQKHPFKPTAEHTGVPELQPMGFLTLLRSEVHIEWMWEGWLQKAGYMLLSGPSQVGKTQVALNTCIDMALGKPSLDKPTKQGKIGFFSLEMNHAELKEFLSLMQSTLTPEEQEVLEQNLQFFPLGEPLYLNRSDVRETVEQIIGDNKFDGVVFDSLGSTTNGELSNETAVKVIIDWNDRLRQRTGAFTWFIHHHRKASGDNKKPNKLDDVYGNQYITARATSVVCLWQSNIENTIELIPLKVRLRKKEAPTHIKRGVDLRFTRVIPGLTQAITSASGGTLSSVSIDLTQPQTTSQILETPAQPSQQEQEPIVSPSTTPVFSL